MTSKISCVMCYDEDSSENHIIKCKNCEIQVHVLCYGIQDEQNFICSPCANKVTSIDCAICGKKDGAMKKTTDDRWVHVICAFFTKKAQFIDTNSMEPVDISSVKAPKQPIECVFCEQTVGTFKCSKRACSKGLHATCGLEKNSLQEKLDNEGQITFLGYCDEHKNIKNPKRLSSDGINHAVLKQKHITQASRQNSDWILKKICQENVEETNREIIDINNVNANTNTESNVSQVQAATTDSTSLDKNPEIHSQNTNDEEPTAPNKEFNNENTRDESNETCNDNSFIDKSSESMVEIIDNDKPSKEDGEIKNSKKNDHKNNEFSNESTDISNNTTADLASTNTNSQTKRNENNGLNDKQSEVSHDAIKPIEFLAVSSGDNIENQVPIAHTCFKDVAVNQIREENKALQHELNMLNTLNSKIYNALSQALKKPIGATTPIESHTRQQTPPSASQIGSGVISTEESLQPDKSSQSQIVLNNDSPLKSMEQPPATSNNVTKSLARTEEHDCIIYDGIFRITKEKERSLLTIPKDEKNDRKFANLLFDATDFDCGSEDVNEKKNLKRKFKEIQQYPVLKALYEKRIDEDGFGNIKKRKNDFESFINKKIDNKLNYIAKNKNVNKND